MSHSFVPLSVPASAKSAEGSLPRLKVIPQSEATQAFKPFQPATAVVPNLVKNHSHTEPTSAPKITLQREGERVTHIRVECGCGEIIELVCLY